VSKLLGNLRSETEIKDSRKTGVKNIYTRKKVENFQSFITGGNLGLSFEIWK